MAGPRPSPATAARRRTGDLAARLPWAFLACWLLAAGAAHARDAVHRLVPPGVAPAPPVKPLAVTPEMRAWVRERVGRAGAAEGRVDRLLRALQAPEVGLRYDPFASRTAADVFADRRFNCLAFAHLFVALAREVGVEAYYLEVPRAERYRRAGDLVLHSGHVAAAWGPVVA